MTARKLHQAARRSREIASLKDKHLYANEPKVMRRRVYPDSEKAALRLDSGTSCRHDVPETLEIEFESKLRFEDPDFVGFDV